MAIPNELQTQRLYMRPPSVGDAELLFERYARDAEVCRYVSWLPHRSVEFTRAYLQKAEDEGKVFRLIFSLETDELLGSIGGQADGHRLTFGYCLARDAWGRGFATEAARAFVAAASAESDIWRIQAYCDVENLGSARVLEKAGLIREGILKRFLIMPNLGPEPRDMLCYAKARGNAQQAT